jgi:maleylacetoacetate isomerase
MPLTLHSMWRATAPYRVRIGLNLKGLAYAYVAVDLVGGEARRAPYLALNRQGLTPALETDEGVLTQSLAILEWLDETHPDPPLLPKAPRERALVRAMAEIVACDMHPLNNLRVLQALNRLGAQFGSSEQQGWIHGWMAEGFGALEPMVERYGGAFAFGDSPSLADCCLVPQAYSAERYGFDLTAYPRVAAAVRRASELPAVAAAHPDRQPDAPKA